MNLLDLPVKIGALIFEYLDMKSKLETYSVYQLRKFYEQSVVRKFDVSRSSLASVKSLYLDLFQDSAANIQELNLSGIKALTASQLAQHIQRCVNLKTLDVTFTSIFLSDLEAICPQNLKNISINFFERLWKDITGSDVWKASKDLFQQQHFEYVHFIVYDPVYTDLPLLFMNELPRTKSLKITVNEYDVTRSSMQEMYDDEDENEDDLEYDNKDECKYVIEDDYEDDLEDDDEYETEDDLEDDDEYETEDNLEYENKDECKYDIEDDLENEDMLPNVERNIDLNFEKLNYVFRNCAVIVENGLSTLSTLSSLDYKQIEYILIMHQHPWQWSHNIVIYVSPIFSSLFAKNFSHLEIVVATRLPHLSVENYESVWFKAWRKPFTVFNDAFFKTLLGELTDFVPTFVCMHDKIKKMKLTDAPNSWYCLDSCEGLETTQLNLPEKVTLSNYCRRKGRKFRTNPTNRPVYLAQSNLLKNVTFLGLSGVRPREDFFSTLFKQCENLHTLDIGVEFRLCMPSLRNSMQLTKSLRNIRLCSAYIQYETLFASLCQCPSLENVDLKEYGCTFARSHRAVNTQNMILFMEKCDGLYSLFIERDMWGKNAMKLETSLRAAVQQLERASLVIHLVGSVGTVFNPFADVFNPSPLHIVK